MTASPEPPVVLLLAPGQDVPARLRALAPAGPPVLVALSDSSTAQDLRAVLAAAADAGLVPTRVDTADPATRGLPRVSLAVEFTPSSSLPVPAPGSPAGSQTAVAPAPAVRAEVVAGLLEWAARREAGLAEQLQEVSQHAEAGDLATDRLARALADRDALAVELESARRSADALTQDLTRLRRSGPFRVGNLLARAAREPRRTPAVTRELVGLARQRWRTRGTADDSRTGPGQAARLAAPASVPAPAVDRDASPQTDLVDVAADEPLTEPGLTPTGPAGGAAHVTVRPTRGSARMLLAHRSLRPAPRLRPSVAAVVTDATAAALDPYVDLIALHPHDAADLIRRTDPDLVLVETAATGPGQPWAYLGYPGMATRHRALVEALDAARAAGRPVALWGDSSTAEAAALLTVPGLVDLRLGAGNPVVDSRPHLPWDRGVPWHLFSPAGFSPADAPAPTGSADSATRAGRVHLLDWDLRTPWSERVATLQALAEAGPVRVLVPAERVLEDGDVPAELAGTGIERVPWARTASVYRAAAVALASPFTSSLPSSASLLEQLACGLRVVSGPRPGVPGSLTGLITWVGAPPDSRELAEALSGGALSADEQLDQARSVFAAHATPVRLAELTARLGVAADPLAGRRVHVLADAPGGRVSTALVDDVLAQRWRPAGVLLVDGGGDHAGDRLPPADDSLTVAQARSRLGAAGLPSRAVAAVDPVLLTDVTWVARWSPPARWSPWHLLDALATAEAGAGRADAVLPGPGALTYRATLSAPPWLVRAACLPGAATVAAAWPADDLPGWAASGRMVLTGGGMVP